MRNDRSHTPDGDDDRQAGRLRILMVDRNILTLWADAARQRQADRLQAIIDRQHRSSP